MSELNPTAAAAPLASRATAPAASGSARGGFSASHQLVSWPVALQCARARMRGGPVIVFSILLVAAQLNAARMRSGAEIFGGLSIFTRGFLLGLTLALGAGLISEEIDSGHAQLVLLRPLSRAAFFGGRLAGAGLALLGAMGAAWVLAIAATIAGGRFTIDLLAALPVGFIWAFSWLSLLACISAASWARGPSNAVWVLIAVVLGGMAKLGLMGAAAISKATQHDWPLLAAARDAISAAFPYIGPQDPTDLLAELAQHGHLDFGPLLYDLAWIAVPWALGAWIFSRRELARRRS